MRKIRMLEETSKGKYIWKVCILFHQFVEIEGVIFIGLFMLWYYANKRVNCWENCWLIAKGKSVHALKTFLPLRDSKSTNLRETSLSKAQVTLYMSPVFSSFSFQFMQRNFFRNHKKFQINIQRKLLRLS